MPNSPIRINRNERTVRRNGRVVRVQSKPFQLLDYLVSRQGEVIPRSVLLREVWADVIVGRQALGFALHALRIALGDDGKRQEIIRTYPRQGVAFVGSAVIVDSISSTETVPIQDAPMMDNGVSRNEIVDAFKAVRSGTGRTCLILGEVGTGKTFLMDAFASEATRGGTTLFRSNATHGNSKKKLDVWFKALKGSQYLATLGDDGSGNASEVASRLRFALEEVSGDHAVAVLIDDLHLADEESISLFEYLAEELRLSPILLVGSIRDPDHRVGQDCVRGVLEKVALSHVKIFELKCLGIAQVGDYIDAVLDSPLRADMVQLLHSKTGGNPACLSQVLGSLKANRNLSSSIPSIVRVGVPPQLQRIVLQQSGSLEPETKLAVEASSIFRNAFPASAVLDLLGRGQEYSEVCDRLRSVVNAGLLEELSTRGIFRFRIGLAREAIYDSVPAEKRSCWHKKASDLIRLSGEEAMELHAREFAFHLHGIESETCFEEAIKYSQIAASQAMRSGDLAEGVHLLEWCKQSLASTSGKSKSLCRVLIDLGDARFQIGDREGAMEAILESFELAIACDDERSCCEAALLWSPDFLSLETGVYDAEHVALLNRALGLARKGDHQTRSILLARLCVALHWSDEGLAAVPKIVSEATELSIKSGDRATIGYVETCGALAKFSVRHPERMLTRGAELGADLDPALVLMRRLLRVTAHWIRGEMGEVKREVREFGSAARALNQKRAIWYEGLFQSSLALMEGRFTVASELGRRYSVDGQAAGDRNAIHSHILQQFMASIDVGGVDAMEDGVREMVDAFPRVEGWRSGLLLFLAETGRLNEADEMVSQALAGGALDRPKRNEWFALVGALAIAASRTENAVAGRLLYKALLPHADQLALVGYGSFCWGSAEHLLGLCATSFSDWRLAEVHLGRSLIVNRAIGARAALARTHCDMALALRKRGNEEGSESHVGACGDLCRELGMRRLAQRAVLISSV